MKVESFTKVEYFLHIGISVLLLFSNSKVATSLFHHEGGVCYQGEYFFTYYTVLFFKCRIVSSLFDHEGGLW